MEPLPGHRVFFRHNGRCRKRRSNLARFHKVGDAFVARMKGDYDNAVDLFQALPADVNSVLEIVINGVDAPAIAGAMRAGIAAACREGVVAISAGNYGGKLGPHHFYLRQIMAEDQPQ